MYDVQVKAIGQPGQTTSIYTTLPGQKAVRHCAITVGYPQLADFISKAFGKLEQNLKISG